MTTQPNTVETIGHLPCAAAAAWKTVCFFEHVHSTPSWFLRTVLPIPERTTGCYGKVGDESRCQYSDGGYLAKKIIQVVEGSRIDFDIIEQSIRYHRSVTLKGGTIYVESKGDDACAVHMITHYQTYSPLLALIRPFIVMTVAAMHRFVMRDMLTQICTHEIAFTHRHDAFDTNVAGLTISNSEAL